MGRGIFRLADEPLEIHDEKFQWMLWSKGRAVVSHESALAVHDVGEPESGKVHLTAPPGFTMRHRAVVVHHATLAASDLDRKARFPVTTVLRSVIDVAGVGADEDQLARAIDEAMKGGHFTLRELRGRSEAVDLRGALRKGSTSWWSRKASSSRRGTRSRRVRRSEPASGSRSRRHPVGIRAGHGVRHLICGPRPPTHSG